VTLHLAPAPAGLYRVGWLPEPFSWRLPAAHLVESDSMQLTGGRWDAPTSEFGTLYCADSSVVAFAETIAAFRPVPGLVEKIAAATDEDEPDGEFDPPARTGELPRTYFEPRDPSPRGGRALGRATLADERMLVDVSHPDSHHELNSALDTLLRQYRLDRFDRGVMMTQDRRITRRVAGFLHAYAANAIGIRYESRFLDAACFALWERVALNPGEVDPVTSDTPDLRRAAELLHIRMPS
jgi:hypothetical protein